MVEYDPQRDRFMPYCAKTSIGDNLNANTIIIDSRPIAIATQYPLAHQLEAHLRLLFDNRSPVLVVLASSTDIQNHQLPPYFAKTANFGELQTHARFVDYIELSEHTEIKNFQLIITVGKESFEIPVLHVHTWPDHQAIRPDTTIKLVELIESTIAQSMASQPDDKPTGIPPTSNRLPLIHCKAGVGRSGQTIAAMALKRYPDLPLETIVKDIRASRNDQMIQTRTQMKTLVSMTRASTPEPEHVERKRKKNAFSLRNLFGKKQARTE